MEKKYTVALNTNTFKASCLDIILYLSVYLHSAFEDVFLFSNIGKKV